MSDVITIVDTPVEQITVVDMLPEGISTTEPKFYQGYSTYDIYLQETTDDPKLNKADWLSRLTGKSGSVITIGENGNWFIDGVDTGQNAIAPTDEHVQSLIAGYSEPKKGADDYYVSALQIASIATISDKVDKADGYSLVLSTEIAKIHTRNTDSTLLSEDGTKSIYLDNSGVFHVGKISQSGESYETHAEQLFTTKNEIILRDGAIVGLAVGEYVGFRAKLYDGVNDGLLVYDKDGFARVGDIGALSRIATIQETPTNNLFTYYDSETLSLKTRTILASDIPTLAQSQIANLTADLSLLAPKANPIFSGVVKAPSYQDQYGNTPFVAQNGGTIYHTTPWITGTTVSTFTNRLIKTGGSNFTAEMVGAKVIISGEERIISAYVDANTVDVTGNFSQNYVGVIFGIYSKAYQPYSNIPAVRYNINYDISGNITIFTDLNGNYSVGSLYARFNILQPANQLVLNNGVPIKLSNTSQILFSSTYQAEVGLKDLGLKRNSAGVLEINNGTAGTYRDLKLRNLYADKIVPNADSTTALQIMKADGVTPVLTVDTTVGNLTIVGSIKSSIGSFISNAGDVFIKTNGGSNVVFRGVRASSAWSDAVDTQWFQVGNSNDNIVFTAQSGSAALRMGFFTKSFNINTSNGRSAPVGLFDISDGNIKLFNVLAAGNVGVGYYEGVEITNNKLAVNGSIFGTELKTSAGTLTYGANDSAGAGYRTVRVPNI